VAKLTWVGTLAFGCWLLFSAALRWTLPLHWHRRLEAAAGASSEGLTAAPRAAVDDPVDR